MLPETQQLLSLDDNLLGAAESLWGSVWNTYVDVRDLDNSFRRWSPVALAVIISRRRLAAVLGRNYVRALDLSAPDWNDAMPPAQLVVSMHVTGIAAAKASIGRGEEFERASRVGASLSWGAAHRHILDAQRDVVREASVDVGWRRVGVGGCDFCRMLIGRGAVYKQATASFRSHDRCRCAAEPAVQ